MEPDEVANMVARLTGDGTSYMKMMQDAEKEAKQLGSTFDYFVAHWNQLTGAHGSIAGVANATLSALKSIGAEGTLRELFGLYEQHEEIHIKLKAAVESHGGAVRETLQSYEHFAKQISASTTLGKDSVLSLVKRAEAFGLTGSKAEGAVQSAIALGEASDTSAEAMIRMTAQFEQGDLKRAMAFARMVPQLRGVKDQAEFVRKYQDLVNVGMKQTEELAKTAGGQIKQLSNSWTGFKKELGATVAEAIKPVLGYLKTTIDLFKGLSPETKKMIVYVLGAVAAFVSLAGTLSIAIAIFGPLVATLLPGIAAGLALLLSPIGLVTAALAVGAGMWIYYSGAGGKAIEWFTRTIQQLREYIQPAIDGVTDAIKAGNIELAVKIVWAQIQLSFAEGSLEIRKIWSNAINFVADTFSILWQSFEEATAGVLGIANRLYADYLLNTNQVDQAGHDFIIKAATAQTADMIKKSQAAADARRELMDADTKREIEGFGRELDALKKERDKLVKEAHNAAAKVPPLKPMKLPDIKIPNIPPIALKAKVDKLEFAEFGTAAGNAQLIEQANKFGVLVGKGGDFKGKDPNTGLLRNIRDIMQKIADKEGIQVEPADLDDLP